MSNKYLFVINSKVASLVSNLVIHHLQLDIKDCYFAISRHDMHLLSEAMQPDNAIFIDDIEKLLQPCSVEFDCYRYIACIQHLIKRVTQSMKTLEFELFTPSVSDFVSYALASSSLCKKLSIIEQGFTSYTYNVEEAAYSLSPSLVAHKYEEFFKTNPSFNPSNTGVKNFVPLHNYEFEALGNPAINGDNISFYRLNRQTFYGIENANLTYAKTLTGEEKEKAKYNFITFDLEQVKQESYQGPLLQVAAQYQEDLSYFHVLAVDPIYNPFPTEEDYEIYANHIRTLLARIQHQNKVEMIFVRFSKNVSQREKNIVTDLLDVTDFYFLILEEEFNLELEFALSPPNQFIVHSISSELLLYAQTFQQIACEYIDLVIHDKKWNNYLTKNNYYIKTILGSLAAEANANESLPYRHLFLVTSEVSLATTLSLIKQFKLNTEHCFMLTDIKSHPKVAAIFNEFQVMLIEDFETIYEHVNSERKVIYYLDAATYVNSEVNKFIDYANYSFYTDSMDSYLSMQLASHFRCHEVNLIEAGTVSAQPNNNFGLRKSQAFFKQLSNKFPQQVSGTSPAAQDCIVSYCFRLRKYAFTQPIIASPMMLINLQAKQLRELNLYNQIIEPVDDNNRIHLLVIENNQDDYEFIQQYLMDYASMLRSLEDRHLSHLYIMLIHPNINIFNQLKNLIITTGIPSSLFYNIDLFSELFYSNKIVRVHTMSPRIAALAQFAQQPFTLYQNSLPVHDDEVLPSIKVRNTLTEVIMHDLNNISAKEENASSEDVKDSGEQKVVHQHSANFAASASSPEA